MNKDKVIISLFDYSGNWSQPYVDNGYDVVRVDIKNGRDIFEFVEDVIADVMTEGVRAYGVLAAPPCTDFASSGARWFKGKESIPATYDNPRIPIDFKNTVEYSLAMVYATQAIIEFLNPIAFYAIENPVGRIRSLVPELGEPWYFQPSDFGEPYTKKTAIYGKFNIPAMSPVLPLFGSEMWSKYGGKSEKTKAARSNTPKGFAKAFFEANK